VALDSPEVHAPNRSTRFSHPRLGHGPTQTRMRWLGRMPSALDQQNRLSAVPALGAFQFPGREATDVNVKRVDVGRRAVACELNL